MADLEARYLRSLINLRDAKVREAFETKLEYERYVEQRARVAQLNEIIDHARNFFKGGEDDGS